MSSSRWLGPALGAGFSAGLTSAGFGAAAPFGAMAGQYLGNKFKAITGYGDYTVAKNSLLGGNVPSVANPTIRRGLTIFHKEYLGDLFTDASPNTFNVQSFTINPGSSQTFEWLAQIACNYEQWCPEGILFMFKSTSGDALTGSNTALGSVILATQYNPYNPPFESLAEMLSYQFASAGVPSQDILHPVECAMTDNPLSEYYVRTAAPKGDLRFNDLGTFYVATTGFQGQSVNIGQLWVTYQITLLKPKLYAALGLYEDYFCAKFRGETGFSASHPMGLGTATIDPASTVPMTAPSDPGSNGYQSVSTGYFGTLASRGMYLTWDDTGGAGRTRFYPPLYAFPITYMVNITHRTNTNDVDLSGGITGTGVAGTPFGAAPVIIRQTDAPDPTETDANFWTFTFVVAVPGYGVLDGSATTRPHVEFINAKWDPNPDSNTMTYFEVIQMPPSTMTFDMTP